jgi:hypothetical protein
MLTEITAFLKARKVQDFKQREIANHILAYLQHVKSCNLGRCSGDVFLTCGKWGDDGCSGCSDYIHFNWHKINIKES